jgi:hypothetical protein
MKLWEARVALALSIPRSTLSLSIETRERESAISALPLMTYQAEITGAEIAVIAIPAAHTRERESNERVRAILKCRGRVGTRET